MECWSNGELGDDHQRSASAPLHHPPHHSITSVRLACQAMATRFEVVLYGDDLAHLRAAGEEVITEIERLEEQLSLYRGSSEIAHINARAAREAVRVSPPVFALLEQAKKLHAETGGAFDITIGPLVRSWGFMGGAGRLPAPEEIAQARAKVGMHLVELYATDSTVRFAADGVMLDLGAIGKGYAIERSAELLREAGITSALLHGGTSSVYGLGCPPGLDCWQAAIADPRTKIERERSKTREALTTPLPHHSSTPSLSLTTVSLRDEALSISSVSEKFFETKEKRYAHVIDPRTGEPASGTLLAAVMLPSATETDALSTALLTVGAAGHQSITKLRPGMRSVLLTVSGELLDHRSDMSDASA